MYKIIHLNKKKFQNRFIFNFFKPFL